MQAGWVRVQAEEDMGLAVGWGLTEKKDFICVWSLAAEGAAECTASPGLCFVNGCLFVSYVYTSTIDAESVLCMNSRFHVYVDEDVFWWVCLVLMSMFVSVRGRWFTPFVLNTPGL